VNKVLKCNLDNVVKLGTLVFSVDNSDKNWLGFV
jgi:hypothetical protein